MSPNDAAACDEMTAIAYLGDAGGELTLRVNGVTLLRDNAGGSTGFVPPTLLLEGENILTVEMAGAGSASAEVFTGCKGEFPKDPGQNDKAQVLVQVTAPGSETVTFTQSGLPAYSYLDAEPSDDNGLRDAIAGLIETARSKDVEGYLAYLEPMLHDFALDDPEAPEMLRNMASFVIASPAKVADPGPLTIVPVLGGRAYQVTDSQGDGPLQFIMPGDEAETLKQAAIWMQTADGWKVLRHW